MRRAWGTLLSVVSLSAACGARTPLIVDETCRGPTIAVVPPVPTVYFVLDHSLSMKEDAKWDTMRYALARVIQSVGERGRFAAVLFPGASDVCSAGTEALAPAPGGVFMAQRFLAATNADPAGGTPTAPTLLDLADKLAGAKDTFVLLATDGGPNCNRAITCSVDTCILNVEGLGGCSPGGKNCCAMSSQNCLDDARAEDAVAKLAAAGVPTYVVGIPGSALYGPVLDAMAEKGGTARPGSPKYWRVDSVDALAATFEQVADAITARCALPLAEAPKHPSGARVSVRGAWRTPGTEFRLEGATLTLLAGACEDYASDPSSVHVEDGCVVAAQ